MKHLGDLLQLVQMKKMLVYIRHELCSQIRGVFIGEEVLHHRIDQVVGQRGNFKAGAQSAENPLGASGGRVNPAELTRVDDMQDDLLKIPLVDLMIDHIVEN